MTAKIDQKKEELNELAEAQLEVKEKLESNEGYIRILNIEPKLADDILNISLNWFNQGWKRAESACRNEFIDWLKGFKDMCLSDDDTVALDDINDKLKDLQAKEKKA
jgi:hypothetical protein